MPITIINPARGVLWPGVEILAHTDIVGPIPLEWEWVISVLDATTEAVQLQQRSPTNGQRDLAWPWAVPGEQIIQNNSPTLVDGANVRLLVQLVDQFSVEKESLSIAVKYDTTVGLPIQLQALPQAQGGLTAEQAQQLAGTDFTNTIAQSIDALLSTELTSGPTDQPLVVELQGVTFGVIVRLTAIPDELVPQTPDNQYWVKTLATVRVFRANDLWFRVPIHTPTKIVPFAHEGLQVWVTSAELNEWLLQIRVLVDFLPGVFGQVYQMHFP